MDRSYLLEILNKLNNGQNIIFTKYGDGEYLCMKGEVGSNVDADSYHPWLGQMLKKVLISLSQKSNAYIGKWWHAEVYEFCDQLAWENNITIPWVWYHLFMNDDEALKFDYMRTFVDFIVKTKRKKILICNSMNKKLRDFFKADIYIEIPPRNWSFAYNEWKDKVEKELEKDAIVLISGGLCSKVLIDDITNKCELTCIDLGSSFDLLARQQHTRGWRHSYEEEVKYYQDFLVTPY